ncbi:tail-related protein [Alteromonas phage vB_AmeP_PT11-V19]|nr:tail-related protein [Alteromonas phage vB_AmeP_PT11-V19]
MSDIYSEGTISIAAGSHNVIGVNTYFLTIGLIKAGSMLTVDGQKFYRVSEVISDTKLTIESLVGQNPYEETGVGGSSYTIVKSFARQTNAGLAADFVAFKQQQLQEKFHFYNWVYSLDSFYTIGEGEEQTFILTPKGFQELLADLEDGEVTGGTGGSIAWSSVLGKPETATRWPTFDEITGKPSTYPAESHSHSWNTISDIPVYAIRWPSFSEITGDINEFLPAFATRWPSFNEVTEKPEFYPPTLHNHSWSEINGAPETATRWPNFSEVTETVSESQLPITVTANKRSLAESPPVKREKSFNQILSDYPTLKKTEVRPIESPNNKRLIQFDDVRGEVHIALTDRWFTIPTTIASRAFPVFYRGLILRFNNSQAYTGNIKMRVYPMGTGGLGLPNNPTLANHQWHEYETTIPEEDPLYKIGEFNSEYFEGIIEYIELDTGWHQFDVNQSDVGSLNAKFDTAFGTLRSPFRTFYQKADGYWYSEDMFPENLHSIGASWVQDANNPRIFTVTEATGSTDALRFFGDSYDDFQFEMVLDVSYVSGTLALTVSNSNPNKVYYRGPARFITDERIYFKRAGSSTTAALTVESLKMRIPHYG